MMTGEERLLEYVAPWPPWVSILVVLGCAVLVFAVYSRESADIRPWKKLLLGGIRFSLIGIVLWMMYGAAERPFRMDLPDLPLVVDDSKSMGTVDALADSAEIRRMQREMSSLQLADPTRLNQAKSVLLSKNAELVNYLREHYQLDMSTLEGDSVANQEEDGNAWIRSIEPTSEQSRLGDAIRSRLRRRRGRPVAAVVLLTDGITTDGPQLSEVAREAKQRNVPLHIVGLGSSTPARDLKLSDLVSSDVVFLGDLVNFDFTLSASGYAGKSVDVILRNADGTEVLAQRQIELELEKEIQTVRLTVEATEKGEFDYVIEVAPDPDEATVENNRLMARVEVRDEKTRVLLVQAYPSFEFYYLRTLLQRATEGERESGGSLELSVLLQEADAPLADIDEFAIRSFPSREELMEYDVCIFGDVNPGFLSQAALRDLRDFIRERGRGFVGIAGPRYFPQAYANTPLAEVLPLEFSALYAPPLDAPIEQGFRPALTELGHQMPSMQLSNDPVESGQIWKSLPELYWLLEARSLKMGVRTLLEHPDGGSSPPAPVITLSYAGAGKVIFHFTDESWRWRIGHGDAFFSRYWLQTILYLSRFKLGEGRDAELTTDRETYDLGETVRVRARFFDDRIAPSDDREVVVAIQRAEDEHQPVVLTRDATQRGSFSADVVGLGSGHYHAWLFQPALAPSPPSVDFRIVVPDSELTRVEVDTSDMQRAAEVSGGRYYTYATASELTEALPAGRQVRMESLTPEPIWNAWPVALAFVALLTTEWLLRRQFGMA